MRTARISGQESKVKRTGIRITFTLFTWALMMMHAPSQEQRGNPSAADLVTQFRNEKVFWKQFEIAKKIVALHDPSVLSELAGWLDSNDRHLRGNVAFIFTGLGDDRGF